MIDSGNTTVRDIPRPFPIGSNSAAPSSCIASSWSAGDNRTIADRSNSPENMFPFTSPTTAPNMFTVRTRLSFGSEA